MTEDEFKTELLTLSPKIEASLAQPGTDAVKAALSTLAIVGAGTTDLDSVLAALKANPAEMTALENQIATRVAVLNPAAAGIPVAGQATTGKTTGPPTALPSGPAGGGQGATPPPSIPGAATDKGRGPAPPPSTPPANAAPLPPMLPARGYMWVAPTVSFGVMLGFFLMLSVLLWREYTLTSATLQKSIAQTQTTQPSAGPPMHKTPPSTVAPANTPEPVSLAMNPPGGDRPTGSASVADPAPLTPIVTTESNALQPPVTGSSGLQNVLFTFLGALGAAFTQVMNYWLGSSKGSSDKTDFMAVSPPVQIQDPGVAANTAANAGQ